LKEQVETSAVQQKKPMKSLTVYLRWILKWLKMVWKEYIWEFIDRLDRNNAFLNGGGLSFSLFICIIPTVLILFWILGNFLDSTAVAIQINTLIDTFIPYQDYSETVKEIIFSRVNELVAYKDVAGIVGFGGLLFAASSFFSSVRTVLNGINGATTDYNPIVSKLIDFALIFLVIFLFLAATFLLPILDILRRLTLESVYLQWLKSGIFETVFSMIFSIIIVMFIFSLLYKLVPKHKILLRSSVIGALVAAMLWAVAKEVFGYYVSNFATYGRVYGTYALFVVVAFWIYYTSIVFIIGAVFGKMYDEHHRKSLLEKQQTHLFD